LLAGTFAMTGLDAANLSLSASRGGLLAAYADGGGDPEAITRDLGSDWRLRGIALRRWPAASSLQSAIAAALDIAGRPGFVVRRIDRVRVDLPPRAHALSGAAGWSDQLTALQSARWMVGVALHDGEVWLEQVAPGRLTDPDINALAERRIDVVQDPDLGLAAARVRVTFDDGAVEEAVVAIPPGDPDRPLSDADLADKWRKGAASAGLGASTDAVATAIGSIEDAVSVAPMLALLRAPGSDASG
jgi:2-methylcitrate dehydratase PrpD